jgi:anti-sigma regulatory factor (Ser/Thr protein kinase)
MCLSNSASFPCDVRTPQQARKFCFDCLRELFPAGSDVVDDCLLLVSELTSNAVNAGCSTVGVTVDVHREHVRITADDDAPGVPRRLRAGPGDRSGRGLVIVESLSRTWGVQPWTHGKQVWADVAIRSGIRLAVDCRL